MNAEPELPNPPRSRTVRNLVLALALLEALAMVPVLYHLAHS